jgi:segregation and condensation protein A
MAATLMEIKSRMLLPRAEKEQQPEEDPRRELVRQLLQYKRFKEAAAVLEQRAQEQSQRLPRLPVAGSAGSPSGPPALKPVELWDLVSAFARLLRETLMHQPQTIVVDHTPLQVHIDFVLERLRAQGVCTLKELFVPPHTRSRLVGLFLAILELTKTQQIVPQQTGDYGDITIRLAEPACESDSSTLAA